MPSFGIDRWTNDSSTWSRSNGWSTTAVLQGAHVSPTRCAYSHCAVPTIGNLPSKGYRGVPIAQVVQTIDRIRRWQPEP